MTQLHWQVGNVTITRVPERVVPLPSDVLVPGITPDHLADEAAWIGPYFADDGRLLLSLHAFVGVSGDSTIVVDTCVGPGARPLPGDDAFPGRLDAAIDGGLGAVDFVLCTHLHFDHVGWNTREIDGELVPTFPNARYLVSDVELASLDGHDPNDIRSVSIQPLLDAGVLDPVALDHRLTDEVRLIATPGHTPGHVSVLIESNGATALVTGDLAHTPLQFTHPELSAVRFDADTPTAVATRRAIIDTHTGTDLLVLGTHFAPPTAGVLRRHANGNAWLDSSSPAP